MTATAVPVEKPRDATPEFEDGMMVTVVLRKWATPELPADKVTYLDKYTAIGGVVRNVFYQDAKKWVSLGLIHRDHIFANSAQVNEFSKRLGRNPIAPENLLAAVQRLSPDKIIAMLGNEAATQLAMDVQKLVSGQKQQQEGAEHGTA